MQILAFAASNSRLSINKMLVTHAATVLKEEVIPTAELKILDLNDFEMPIFSIDRELASGVPDAAKTFFGLIAAADALIISYAEHNGLYTAAFKNIFDWCSRINAKVYQGKPMVVLSASPGKNGGGSVLRTVMDSAPYFGADIRGHLSVGHFSQVFDDESGRLTDEALATRLIDQLRALA